MKRKDLVRLSIASLILIGVAVLVVWFLYRPWALTWGSTDEEIARAMPGDEVLENPTFNATRAVTIEATPEEIWPWIVQIGYYWCLYKESSPNSRRINFAVVEAVELWKTRRGFSKPCGKAALSKGWLSIGRQIHSPGSPRPRVDDWHRRIPDGHAA